MRIGTFKAYKNGYYNFWFENGEELTFEEVHPHVLKHCDLQNDASLIDQDFRITFVEDGNDDDVIYRVQSLKPL